MDTVTYLRRSRRFVFAFIAALCVVIVASSPAEAQRGGGGLRRSPRKGGGTKGQRKYEPRDEGISWSDPGSYRSRILKFERAGPDDDGDCIGTLKLKPVHKDGRTMALRVRPHEGLRIEVAGHVFDAAMLADLPWRGQYCTATWGYKTEDEDAAEGGEGGFGEAEKPKRRSRKDLELKSLTLETMEVRGKIEQIDGDVIILKAKPVGDRDWPQNEEKRILHPEKAGSNKSKRVAQKKIRLKMFEDVTKFVASNDVEMDLGDFEVDQEIEATIVFGKSKMGIMIRLRAPGIEGETVQEEQVGPGRKGKGPVGTDRGTRRGTRRGGGGRTRRGGGG